MPHHADAAVNEGRIQRANERAMARKYQIAIIGRTGGYRLRGSDKAPSDAAMIGWATRDNGAFVTRFYPSKKGWLIIDVRNAQLFRRPGSDFGEWRGTERSTKPLPSMDAAIMTAIHMLARHSSTA